MIELLLALGIYLGSPAAAAADLPTPDFGVSGFTAYTVEVEEPQENILEQRVMETPSRSSERQAVEEFSAPAPAEVEDVVVTEPEVAPVVPAPTGGVLDIAAGYVGSPYVLMGTPPAAFDCSAYTWWVFKQAGINIPRSVNGQAAAVTPVSDPQPGDLVFYNDYHHVGIYAGNGMTYEALNPSAGVRFGPMVSQNVWYGRP